MVDDVCCGWRFVCMEWADMVVVAVVQSLEACRL